MSHQLRAPKRKRRAPAHKPSPFPIPLDSSSSSDLNKDWPCYYAELKGTTVFVKNASDADEIYHNGYFGNWVTVDEKTENDNLKYPLRVDEAKSSNNLKRLDEHSAKKKFQHDEMDVIIVSSDEDDAETSNDSSYSIQRVVEGRVLLLSLEEAFFLVFGLGCLSITDRDQNKLNVIQLWQRCCDLQTSFILTYVLYHFYRSKGWVIRHEMKYGSDFLLYKYGPPYYHASYSVLLQPVANNSLPSEVFQSSRKLTWTNLTGLSRVTEHVAKDLIICHVALPENLTKDDLRIPSWISKCEIKEMLHRRWVPSQEREKQEVIS